jgi:hypothetical protein
MPAMLGLDEKEAAREVFQFLEELARKLEREHSAAWGLWKLYHFRASYRPFGRSEEELESGIFRSYAPESLVAFYEIEWRPAWSLAAKWKTVAGFSFWRADWDDTPEMQFIPCTVYAPQFVTPLFEREVRSFAKLMFNCERIRYVSSASIERMLAVA